MENTNKYANDQSRLSGWNEMPLKSRIEPLSPPREPRGFQSLAQRRWVYPKMSAEGRAKIVAAQKARWAKAKKACEVGPAANTNATDA